MSAGTLDPTLNGNTPSNGEQHAASTDMPPSGRDARGRFTKNNPGGPGNAFARQTAAFHRALCSVVSEEDIQAIALKLKEQALAGNLAAIKLLLSYVIGRPLAAANPDTLDLQEWEQLRQAPDMLQEMNRVIQSVTAEDACAIARIVQPAISQELCTQFGEGIQRQEEAAQRQRERRQEREERRQQARQERAERRQRDERPAETRPSPTANGGNGSGQFRLLTPEEVLEEVRLAQRRLEADMQRPLVSPTGQLDRAENASPDRKPRS